LLQALCCSLQATDLSLQEIIQIYFAGKI
jgi:hypothetical protein